MLLAKGRINKDLIAMPSNWRNSGFQALWGNRFGPEDETVMANLAWTITRAFFPQEGIRFPMLSSGWSPCPAGTE